MYPQQKKINLVDPKIRGAFVLGLFSEELKKTQEQLFVLLLSESYELIACEEIAKSKNKVLHFTAERLKRMFSNLHPKYALIAHNHPNDDCLPSIVDCYTTTKLQKLYAKLGITLLDHLIVGVTEKYYSFESRVIHDI